MVRVPRFHCQGQGSIPGRGTKIPKLQRPKINNKDVNFLRINYNSIRFSRFII